MSIAAEDLLADLRALGVDVVASGDRLLFKPPSALTPELRGRMLEQKAELLALLESTAAAGTSYERQPDPPPPDAGPWPKQTVVVDVRDDGRIVSGPLCDADGRAVLP